MVFIRLKTRLARGSAARNCTNEKSVRVARAQQEGSVPACVKYTLIKEIRGLVG